MVLLRDADLGEAQLVRGALRPAAPSLLRNLEYEMVIYPQFPKKAFSSSLTGMSVRLARSYLSFSTVVVAAKLGGR